MRGGQRWPSAASEPFPPPRRGEGGTRPPLDRLSDSGIRGASLAGRAQGAARQGTGALHAGSHRFTTRTESSAVPSPLRTPALLSVAAALALSGCDNEPSRPEPPAAVAALSGNGQPGTVGTQLSNPVVVRVTDDDGDPVKNATVTFQVTSGGGTVNPASAVTGSDGLAQAVWTLGPTVGQQTLTATVTGLPPVAFTATAAAGAPAKLRIQPDSSTIDGVGLEATVQASLVDQFGNPAGTPAAGAVAWTSLEPAVATVAPGAQPGQGRVTAVGAGRARIVASAAGVQPDTAVVGVVRVPGTVAVQVAGGPTLTVGRTAQATATVNDVGGTAIPNAPVTWSSSNDAVATVSGTGLITAVAPGTATITATASNGVARGVTITVVAGFRAGSFSAGGHTTCALTPDGQAYCWGSNHTGQAGYGTGDEWSVTMRAVSTGVRFISISTSGVREPQPRGFPRAHTCAIAADRSAWCWGVAGSGQLGNGSFAGENCRLSINNTWTCQRLPVRVTGAQQWATIATGANHTCAIASPVVYCWGANESGQLGSATTETCPRTALIEEGTPCSTVPLPLTGTVPQFVNVTAGEGFSCALSGLGVAWCWGRNDEGQLGNGTTVNSTTPVQVATGETFVRITAEKAHACAVTTSGKVLCWGRNTSGQLGNGTFASSATPVQVLGPTTWQDVSAGGSHTCGLRAGGAAWCWGSNSDGQLGVTGVAMASEPVQVAGGNAFNDVSAGGWHTCGRRTADSVLMCWGDNGYGRLGNGATTDSAEPVAVQVP